MGEPLIVSIHDDRIPDDAILPKENWHRAPRKVLRIAEHSQNAIVAWVPKDGWMVYAEHEAKQLRAVYFREILDDPMLSLRTVTGED